MTRIEPSRRVPLAAVLLALVPLGLALQTACQAVEPGEMAHTTFTGPAYVTVGGVLTGAHAQTPCEGCHVGQTPPFGSVPDDCIACHWSDYEEGHPFPLQDGIASCNEGCHRVVDYCWNYGTNPACTGGAGTDTGTITDTDTDTTHTGTTTTDTGTVPTGNSCAGGSCHGTGPIRDDAAPASSSHNAHLAANYDLFAPATPLECRTCHPTGADDSLQSPTHQNGTVDVPLTGIAIGDNTGASYAGGTCSGTYCHGAGMADAPPSPVWDGGGGEVSCGTTCHVSPPVNMYDGGSVVPHPGLTSCSTCHSPTGTGNATTLGDKTTHINGTVEN